MRHAATLIEYLMVFSLILTIILSPILLLGLWTQRSLEFWVNYAHNTSDAHVSYWLSLLPAIFVPIDLFCNVATEIARMIL